mmetsp:Transcript_8915/g.12765  ORF Transcript_8915/g.12765 Transcript_8915/m.12765 type:complete len:135 (-) Transcript_8915:86-490(-)
MSVPRIKLVSSPSNISSLVSSSPMLPVPVPVPVQGPEEDNNYNQVVHHDDATGGGMNVNENIDLVVNIDVEEEDVGMEEALKMPAISLGVVTVSNGEDPQQHPHPVSNHGDDVAATAAKVLDATAAVVVATHQI